MAWDGVESSSVKYAQRNPSYTVGVGATVATTTLSTQPGNTQVWVTSPSPKPGTQKCDPHFKVYKLFRSDGDNKSIKFTFFFLLLSGQQRLLLSSY